MASSWLTRVFDFLTRGLWRIRGHELSGFKGFGVRLLRVTVLSLRGLQDRQLHLQASALTFFALLSVVPVVAMGFGFAKGFGLEAQLDAWFKEAFKGQDEIYKRVTEFANSLLANTRGGVIAGVGFALLYWTVIKLLGQVELSFNSVWGIAQQRSLRRRLADYTLVLLISFVLFVVSTSFTVLAAHQVRVLVSQNAMASRFDDVLEGGIRLIPYVVMWVLFSFFYIFMPNTKVRFGAGIIAGVVAGTAYQALQWVYINFQVGVASYNAIYGSFAALPLFLVWLQLSWLVMLVGAQIAFSWQNAETFEFEPDCLRISPRFRSLMALRIVHLLVRRLLAEAAGPSAAEISRELALPIRLVREILQELIGAGLAAQVTGTIEGTHGYQLARPMERMTVGYVLDVLAKAGTDDIALPHTPELEKLSECLAEFGKAVEASPGNRMLKDIGA